MTPRRAEVRLDGTRVGLLEETSTGTRFAYDAAWIANPHHEPVSLALPVRAEAYESPGLLPFFENLLPEGWLLDVAVARLHLSRDDAFGLLVALCGNGVGAVEILPADEAGR